MASFEEQASLEEGAVLEEIASPSVLAEQVAAAAAAVGELPSSQSMAAAAPPSPSPPPPSHSAPSSSSSSTSIGATAPANDEVVGDEEGEEGTLELKKDIAAALAAKELGNNYFRDKDYDGAITLYSQAIAHCPSDEANKENLAVFLGNRAAAYYAIEEFALVVDDCNLALENNSAYVKVLQRRMQALERLERLDEALADAKRIQELEPGWPKIAQTVERLERENAAKMDKLKDEALGKLKELGNSILGNFGMSLDQFKFKQDPQTGSWTIGMDNK